MGAHPWLLPRLGSHYFAAPPSLALLNPNIFPNTTSPNSVHWARKTVGPTSAGRFNFNFDDELHTKFDEHEFEFGGTQRPRVWWNDDNDNDSRDDDEEGNKFLVFQVIKSFGWMLPAIAVSFLVGAGSTNAFLMALVVPLGQTALSLIIDNVWENGSWRPRTKTRKRPIARGTNRMKTDESKGGANSANRRGTYQSWVAAEGDLYKKAAQREPNFGGWDELDRVSNTVLRGNPSEKADELTKRKGQKQGKLGRGRVKETPLLLRLMIAVFPFLGSWAKLLF